MHFQSAHPSFLVTACILWRDAGMRCFASVVHGGLLQISMPKLPEDQELPHGITRQPASAMIIAICMTPRLHCLLYETTTLPKDRRYHRLFPVCAYLTAVVWHDIAFSVSVVDLRIVVSSVLHADVVPHVKSSIDMDARWHEIRLGTIPVGYEYGDGSIPNSEDNLRGQ
ncbi:uncharacterized protein [Lolium perenne]|uniref:uncharacterized protein isoform X2 n=1 Tax=Lolium perenne TaxID=4522 RepID=UPI003A98DB8F